MDGYLIVMSILVYINFQDFDLFREIFIQGSETKLTRDEDIPFPLTKMTDKGFLGPAFGQAFYDNQYMFCPIRIQEREEPYFLKDKERLPWVGQSKEIFTGIISDVREFRIAANYLEYSNRTVNPIVSHIDLGICGANRYVA